MIAGPSRGRERAVQRAQGGIAHPDLGIGFRKQAAEPAAGEPGIHRLVFVEAEAHLAETFVGLAELGQRPAA